CQREGAQAGARAGASLALEADQQADGTADREDLQQAELDQFAEAGGEKLLRIHADDYGRRRRRRYKWLRAVSTPPSGRRRRPLESVRYGKTRDRSIRQHRHGV